MRTFFSFLKRGNWLTLGLLGLLPLAGAAQNVGVGTTSPQVPLHVVGLGRYTVSSGGAGLQLEGAPGKHVYLELYPAGMAGGRQAYLGYPADGSHDLGLSNAYADGSLFLQTGGSTRLVIVGTGNVGVGTGAPLAPLHVEGAPGAGPLLLLRAAGGTGASLDFQTYDVGAGNASGARMQALDNNYSADLIFSTKVPGTAANPLAERLRLTNDGRLGLGTAAPDASAALDVAASDRGVLLPRLTQTQRTGISNPAPGLLLYQTDSPAGFYYNAGTAASPNWQQVGTATGATNGLGLVGGAIGLGGTLTQATTIDQDSHDLLLTGSGNLGLGTSSPGQRLEVAGSVYANGEGTGFLTDVGSSAHVGLLKYSGHAGGIWRTTAQDFEVGRVNVTALPGAPTSFTTDFYISGSGKVGIGTTSPGATLEVRTADASANLLVGKTDATAGAVYFGNTGHGVKRAYSGTNDVGLYTTGGNLYLAANGPIASQFVLTNDGRVGVGLGTGTPTARLEVDGSGGTPTTYTYGPNLNTSAAAVLTASSSDPYEPVTNVRDGNTSTYWSNVTGSPLPAWIQLDFGSTPRKLRQYRLYVPNTTFNAGDWSFQGSTDGATWTTLHSTSGNTFNFGWLTYPVNNYSFYRYYRVLFPSIARPTLYNYLAMGDWEVMEGTSTTPGAPAVRLANGALQLEAGDPVHGFSTDATLSTGGDDFVPTQQAVKTYVDAKAGSVSNRLALAYGQGGAGTTALYSTTGNVTATHPGTGHYRLTFGGSLATVNFDYLPVLVSLYKNGSGPGVVAWDTAGGLGTVDVYTYTMGSVLNDGYYFTFSIFKP